MAYKRSIKCIVDNIHRFNRIGSYHIQTQFGKVCYCSQETSAAVTTRTDSSNADYIVEVSRASDIAPLNSQEGLCRTIKAQYQKNSLANFIRKDALGATAVIEYENE